MLEMATGQPPWHTLNLRTPVALLNWVKRTEGPPPLPEGLSPRLTKFLLRCFERDPKKRATAKDLLSDPFVSKRHGEKLLKHSSSDADSVSDIANLSRTAAIARIKRASLSDCSRPSSAGDSSCATDSAPGSPRSSSQQHAGGGSRKGSVSPTSRSPRGEGGTRGRPVAGGGGSGAGASELGSHAAAAASPPGDVRGVSSAGSVLSVQTTGFAPPPRVDTAAVADPAAAGAPSGGGGGSPRVTTPPPRRVAAGGFRSGSASPNPFGGRRRSVEHSPDNVRSSPRASSAAGPGAGASPARQEGAAARPRDGDGTAAASREEEEEEEEEKGGEGRGVLTPGSDEPTVVMAREATHVTATRGSSSRSSSVLKRGESSSSIGSIINNNGGGGGDKGGREEKKRGAGGGGGYGDGGGSPVSVVPSPVSDNTSLSREQRTPPKKGRSGRGGRPSGAAISGSSANSGGGSGAGDVPISSGDLAEPAWQRNR